MNRNERNHLIAERPQVEGLLATIPASQSITRASFESRLRNLNVEIAAAGKATRLPITGRLTFRGRPVIASQAIYAQFGMAATQAFAEAVTARAASFKGPISDMGPIPNRDDYALLLTGTAIGSFGFQLEEPGDELLLGEETPVGKALLQTQQLFESAVGSDDDLTEATAGLPPRVIKEARKFLETLAAHDAVCNVTVGSRSFGFTDVGQVRRAVDRLDVNNIHEEEQTFVGSFLGVLPTARTFEFRVAAEGTIIRGKIAGDVVDPAVINGLVNRPVQLTLTATRVGEGKPKFVLHRLPI